MLPNGSEIPPKRNGRYLPFVRLRDGALGQQSRVARGRAVFYLSLSFGVERQQLRGLT